MSIATDISTEVAALLNADGLTWSLPFTAKAIAAPVYDLEKMTDLSVFVLPTEMTEEIFSRALREVRLKVDVGVQQKQTGEAEAFVASRGGLFDEISRYLSRRHLTNAKWRSQTDSPPYSMKHLVNGGVFTAVLTVEYSLYLTR